MFRLYQVYSGKVQAVFDGSKPVASLPAYDLYIAEVRSLCWRRCRLALPLLCAHAPPRCVCGWWDVGRARDPGNPRGPAQRRPQGPTRARRPLPPRRVLVPLVAVLLPHQTRAFRGATHDNDFGGGGGGGGGSTDAVRLWPESTGVFSQGETVGALKSRLRRIMGLPEKEFSKYKLAHLVRAEKAEYLTEGTVREIQCETGACAALATFSVVGPRRLRLRSSPFPDRLFGLRPSLTACFFSFLALFCPQTTPWCWTASGPSATCWAWTTSTRARVAGDSASSSVPWSSRTEVCWLPCVPAAEGVGRMGPAAEVAQRGVLSIAFPPFLCMLDDPVVLTLTGGSAVTAWTALLLV